MAHMESSQTDQYANPIQHHAPGVTGHHGKLLHGLYRSKSSSSSSSSSEEEDEHVVMRRTKTGMKIKEKIMKKMGGVGHGQGGHHHQPQASDTSNATTPAGYEAGSEYHHEKTGILDRFKEKLPGAGNHN